MPIHMIVFLTSTVPLVERLKKTFVLYNSIWTWLEVALVLLLALLGSIIFPAILNGILKRHSKWSKDQVAEFYPPLRVSFRLLLFAIAFHIIKNLLNISDWVKGTLDKVTLTIYILAVFISVFRLIPHFIMSNAQHRELPGVSKKRNETLKHYTTLIVKVILVIAAFVSLLSVWGINVSGLLGALGIGGLAISLAAQDTLSNFMGGFTIMADRPFDIGDFVRIGENEGTIEAIGFRSTKMRTLDMFLVIIPNSKVVSEPVVNISRLYKRRVRFEVKIQRSAPAEQVDNFVDKIRKLIEVRPLVIPSETLIALQGVSGTAQIILVQYYIETTDIGTYMKEQEQVLLAINELMAQCGIQSADPLAQSLER